MRQGNDYGVHTLIREYVLELIAICWFSLGLILMYLLRLDLGLLQIGLVTYDALADLLPSIARMQRFDYFDRDIARSYAALVVLAMPVLFIFFVFSVSFQDYSKRIRDRGRYHSLRVGVVFLAIGLVPFITGFGSRGPGGVFRDDPHFFALWASTLTFLQSLSFRLSLRLLINR